MPGFLYYLENTLPNWFRGALYYYKLLQKQDTLENSKYDTRTAFKTAPSRESVQFLKGRLWHELQLYYFVQEEFQKKVQGLNRKS